MIIFTVNVKQGGFFSAFKYFLSILHFSCRKIRGQLTTADSGQPSLFGRCPIFVAVVPCFSAVVQYRPLYKTGRCPESAVVSYPQKLQQECGLHQGCERDNPRPDILSLFFASLLPKPTQKGDRNSTQKPYLLQPWFAFEKLSKFKFGSTSFRWVV